MFSRFGRLGTAAMVCAALVSSVIGGHVTAPQAGAVIANPITADLSGDPVESFQADDALFAYFTVDITGGDICVVNVDTIPTPGRNCDSGVAWGTPNHFVGLGTQFQGLEAPFLYVGTWRLLAASTPTTGNPTPTPTLSAPFTVTPCADTCNTTIGQAAITAWKNSAAEATEGAHLACKAFDLQGTFDDAKDVGGELVTLRGVLYDAINVAKKGFRVRIASSTAVVVDFAGGLITVPVPDFSSTEEMAMNLLKQLTCSAGLMHETIMNDPPDPDFTTVAQPVFGSIPNPQSDAGQTLGISLDRQRALGEAMLHAFERYLGATDAGQPEYVRLQAQAMAEFGVDAAQEMRTSALLLRHYAGILGADDAIVDPVVADQQALDAILGIHERIRQDGFLPEELDELVAEGYTTDEIAQMRAMFDLDVSDLPTGVAIDTFLQDAASDFETASVEYDAIAREAASVASLVESPPENQDPTAVDDSASTPANTPVTIGVLLNDFDPDGNALGVSGSTAPAHGTAECSAAGSCLYTPTTDFSGPDSFDYTVSDGAGGSATATVSITVTPPVGGNQPPMAVADDLTVIVNKSAAVSVLDNDSDPDGDTLTLAASTVPSHGTATCQSFGLCFYTPDAGYVGLDTFDYTLADGRGGVDSGTVNITVEANHSPIALDDFLTTRQNAPQPRTAYVLANDTDVDNDLLLVTTNTDAAHGLVDCSNATFCLYTPDADYVGSDSFEYTIADGQGGIANATVHVDVTENHPPIAGDDSAVTRKTIAIQVSVLDNDSDSDNDTIFLSANTSPAHGTADCSSGTWCVYTPDSDYVGPDTFTYTVSDGDAAATANVSIDVLPPCSPARCIDNGTILLAVNPEGHLNARDGSGSDAGPGDVGLDFLPTNNDATSPGCLCEGWGAADAGSGVTGYANISADGGANNLTLESFDVTASTAVSVVTIGGTIRVTHDYHPSLETPSLYEVTVTLENISTDSLSDLRYRRVMDWDIEPTAFDEYVTIQGGNASRLLFDSNDGFATANPLGARSNIGGFTGDFIDAGPTDHGALFDFGFGALNPEESTTFNIFYGAAATEVGAEEAINAVGAEVFSIGQPNLPDGPTLGTPNTFIFAFGNVGGTPIFSPVAQDDLLTTVQDTPGTVDVLGNDSDPNADPLSVTTLAPAAAHGTVACTAAGSCTYTPAAGYFGPDSFDYSITDGNEGSATATVHVTVTITEPPNTPPTAAAGPDVSGTEGSPIALDGTASDPDPDDTLTTTWSYVAGSGVDAGATCSFGNAAAVDTTITCTDDGPYTVTLSVNDGHNPPVTDSATLTVANANPTVDISAPLPGASFTSGTPVSVSAMLADAGANDTLTCSIDWGDGTTSPGNLSAGICSGSHSYPTSGDKTIVVSAADDDTGTGSDSVAITITEPPNTPPTAAAGPDVSGTEGSPIALDGTASDPDPDDTLTTTWSYVAGSGVDAGATCSFGNAAAVDTTITCTDDGPYTVTLSVNDGHNPPVTDSATLTVANANPTVDISAPLPGASFTSGTPVSVSAMLADAGANDTLTCSIDWGDGTTSPGNLSAGICSGSHSYPTSGDKTIVVSAADDDTGTGSDSVAITITEPPTGECSSTHPTSNVERISPPPSVRLNGLTSDTCVRLFEERQDSTLDKTLRVDISTPGTYERRSDLTPFSIPAGTIVDSHFLHADNVGNAKVRLQGSVTFDADIIGVIVTDSSLDLSDRLGAPGTRYSHDLELRGLELTRLRNGGDLVAVSADLRTLTFDVTFSTVLDQIRVITANRPPSLSIGNVAITEGNSGTRLAKFELRLSYIAGQPVTVNYVTVDGSALQPADYIASAGSLSFAPGQTKLSVNVVVVGDTLREPQETFTVELSAPANATIADGIGLGTIIDNDKSRRR